MVTVSESPPTSADGVRRASRIPSRAIVVAVGYEVTISSAADGGTISPGLAGLRLLQELAGGSAEPESSIIDRVTRETGAAYDKVAEFMDQLDSAELLTDRVRRRRAASATPPSSARPVLVPPTDDPRIQWFLLAPVCLELSADGYVALDYWGRRVACLDAVEVMAAATFAQPADWSSALAAHRLKEGENALSELRFVQLMTKLREARLLKPFERTAEDLAALGVVGHLMRTGFAQQNRLREAIGKQLDEHEVLESARREKTGIQRIRVVPVAHNSPIPPLALGLIFASAAAYDGGRLNTHYDFYPSWVDDPPRIERIAAEPGVFMFSNYIWTFERCLETSRRVKEINPHNVTVHGGPSTPRYPADTQEFFRLHPHVDVTVRGEGEATAVALLDALRGAVGDGPANLDVLRDVAGLAYRDGDTVVETAPRERISNLDTIPSPYLTGLFDAYASVPELPVTLETNRGCPYGCTFCDWGSATLSRIRAFDLERVFAEIEWCGQHQVSSIGIADANFGIWSRDVAIAEKIAEMRREHGYPGTVGFNNAKNTVKHLREILALLVGAGLTTDGLLALQSMDQPTLDAIDRSNIKLEKYEELSIEMRRAGLRLAVDILFGLPGQTLASFRNDLQECTDREVEARIAPTELLVNSPMNEPGYRQKYAIEVATSPLTGDGRSLVVATATFTREEHTRMTVLHELYSLFENYGALRQVSRWVRQETGMRELDWYERLLDDATADPDRWPALNFMTHAGYRLTVAPVSWALLIDELREHLTAELGVRAGSGLDVALVVQYALLPDRERSFPATIELRHDFVSWHGAMMKAKDAGHLHDWHEHVPTLESYPTGSLTIRSALMASPGTGLHFEMDSPVSRVPSVTDEQLRERLR